MIAYRTIPVDGTEVFYREGGNRTTPLGSRLVSK